MSKVFLSLFYILLLSIYSIQPVFAESTFKVLKVIDGDTIQVDVRGNKETVRLLGIDSPETVDPRKAVQCFGKAASDKMKSFVSGKSVILVDEKVTQGNRDKYNRLLRYVYLPDKVKTFVNGEMVKQGYAFSYRQYPTKFLNKFNTWEAYARDNNLGLWGSCPLYVSPTKKPTVNTNTAPAYNAPSKIYQESIVKESSSKSKTNSNLSINSSGKYTCSGKTVCGQMNSCAEAYFYLKSCGVKRLDGDKDGVPCESICN